MRTNQKKDQLTNLVNCIKKGLVTVERKKKFPDWGQEDSVTFQKQDGKKLVHHWCSGSLTIYAFR